MSAWSFACVRGAAATENAHIESAAGEFPVFEFSDRSKLGKIETLLTVATSADVAAADFDAEEYEMRTLNDFLFHFHSKIVHNVPNISRFIVSIEENCE